jgi:parvulin-like peptidyl-prolyl isomerase
MRIATRLMLVGLISLLYCSSVSAGEKNSPPTQAHKDEGRPASSSQTTGELVSTVGATRPVITVHGVCKDAEGRAESRPGTCDIVVTRQEFDDVIAALNPRKQPVPASARRSLARGYAEFLAFDAAARKAGMEDTPEFRALMDWTRLRTIFDLYRNKLQEQYHNLPEQEIDAYYREHFASYERVKLARILISRDAPTGQDKSEFDRKALEAARAARDRAIKGDDPEQIEKDAYAALGLSAPPPVDLGNRRRNDFVPEESTEIFGLKVGEVSKVETEPTNYVVYKVMGKEAQSKDELRSDIVREISQQKFKAAMKAIADSVHAEFNEEYFGPDTAADPAVKTPAIPVSPH